MPNRPTTDLCLGGISGPLVVFGGPYSNFQALEAIKKEAERLGIPPERCFCTGDIVAYCGQPQATVQGLRDWGAYCLMGNCEESLANNSEDCGCGFSEGTQCDILSAQWFQFTNQALPTHARSWFSQLPRSIYFSLDGIDVQLVHGSVSSINQFIFPSTPIDTFEQECAKSQAQLIIGGHSGIPFTKTVGQTLWHNAGAIGMPANDGTNTTWFSVISSKDNELRIETRRLEYDYQTAHQEMITAGLDNGYAECLVSGLWPSMDVLPNAERKQQGQPLMPTSRSFYIPQGVISQDIALASTPSSV